MPIGNALTAIRGVSKIKFFNFDIIIDSNKSSWNLTNELVLLGWNKTDPIKGTVTINNGVVISGTATTDFNKNGTDSFTVGTYNDKSQIRIINNGKIIGCGGFGGSGDITKLQANGGNGGNAMSISNKIRLTNNGEIIGGGGGGGGNVGGGGGGAGIPAGGGGAGVNACMIFGNLNPCYSRVAGTAGNSETGGMGGVPLKPERTPPFPDWIDKPNGGNGGRLGAAGDDSWPIRVDPFQYTGSKGKAGSSVKGWSNITYDDASTGTFVGAKT